MLFGAIEQVNIASGSTISFVFASAGPIRVLAMLRSSITIEVR